MLSSVLRSPRAIHATVATTEAAPTDRVWGLAFAFRQAGENRCRLPCPMPLFGQIFAGIAALLHVVFFLFESVLFRQPKIQRRFHVEPAAAEAVKPWAFNQGFYNLFLAIGCFVGIAAMHARFFDAATAKACVIFPCACMVGAGMVLIATDMRMARSAAIQFVPPAIALVSLFV